jgi:hypothetical protein
MLRGPLHNKGANGRCEECGESFPCPTNIAYEAVKRETEASDQVHLVLTRDELATELLSNVVDWPEMITRRTAGLRAQS